jgi:predicted O-linked N-acetylglucosamine transferase (SPINDLY family)
LAELSVRGIEPARVRFAGPRKIDDHLRLLLDIDIALDTFPYNGQTTTCECLWMGVPVVTIAGEYHVSRVGYALLDRVGLPELVASTPAGYVDIAVHLASDLNALKDMRATLRDRVQNSTLFGGLAVTRDIEAAYRRMWREWCATQKETKYP